MKQLGFAFDQGRCIGCRTCQLSCKDYKDAPIGVNFRRVYEYEGGGWEKGENGTLKANIFASYISMACNHCTNPACMRVCPTKAIVKHEDTGIVEIMTDKCIGCDACAQVCPYGAPQKVPETGLYDKCNLCRERLEADKNPICVEACPNRALKFGEIEELRKEYGDMAGVAPFVDPALTEPNFTVIPCKETRPYDEKDIRVTAPSASVDVIDVVKPIES